MPIVILNAHQRSSRLCKHTAVVREVSYSGHVCPECVNKGDTWVQLRICMVCGHVGCCDSSKNRHASTHYQVTQHPVIKTIEDGPDWAWCYPDNTYLE